MPFSVLKKMLIEELKLIYSKREKNSPEIRVGM